jgi:hypothetical protein
MATGVFLEKSTWASNITICLGLLNPAIAINNGLKLPVFWGLAAGRKPVDDKRLSR